MRPYPDEVLRSILDSLRNVIIPNLDDDWARYTAKGMEKLILHLELRWQHELEYLAVDSLELHELMSELRASLEQDALPASGDVDAARAALGALLDGASPPPPAVDLKAIHATNEAYRETLTTVIEALSRAGTKELEPARDKIRLHLRRQLDRDLELTRPTFMLFGAPPATAAGR